MSQNNPQTGQGGAGDTGGPPPTRLANRVEIAVTAAFLVGLTVYLLYGITTRWPACELPDDASVSAPANANANANAPANANAAANQNANVNANANANQNANQN